MATLFENSAAPVDNMLTEDVSLDEMFKFLNDSVDNGGRNWCVDQFVSDMGSSHCSAAQSIGAISNADGGVSSLNEAALSSDGLNIDWDALDESLASATSSPDVNSEYSVSPYQSSDYASDELYSPASWTLTSSDCIRPDQVVPSSTHTQSSGSDVPFDRQSDEQTGSSATKRGRWSVSEDKVLLEAVSLYPGNWKKIATMLGGVRTPQQCLHRWRKSVQPGISRSRWSDAEDALLRRAVADCGQQWTKVAGVMRVAAHKNGTAARTDVQCRERWVNVLDPRICKDAWTAAEDNALLRQVATIGAGKWSLIAVELNALFADKRAGIRTDYACRKRHEKLVRGNATRARGD